MIALLLAAQIVAQSVAQTPAPAAAAKPPAHAKAASPDEVVCRADMATGHRISARTCRTRSEWAQQEDASNRLMNHQLTTYGQGNTCTPGLNC